MQTSQFPSRHGVKITVLRRLYHKDLMEQYTDSGDWGPCSNFQEGQEFTVTPDRPWEMPPGFCGWAWADIQKVVWGMARGGPNVFVTCCTDGCRPVIFKLEKLSET